MDYSMVTTQDKIEKFFDSKIMQQSLRSLVFIKVKKSSDIIPNGDIECSLIGLPESGFYNELINACNDFIYTTACEFCRTADGINLEGGPNHFCLVKDGKAIATHITTYFTRGPMWLLKDYRNTPSTESDDYYNYFDFVKFLESLEKDQEPKPTSEVDVKYNRLYDVSKVMFKLNNALTREGNYCVDKASLKKQLIDIINEELGND